jgi:hypothetical protein
VLLRRNSQNAIAFFGVNQRGLELRALYLWEGCCWAVIRPGGQHETSVLLSVDSATAPGSAAWGH